MGSMSMGDRMRDWSVEESGDKKEETAGETEGGPAERELTDREERQVEAMTRPIDGDGFTRVLVVKIPISFQAIIRLFFGDKSALQDDVFRIVRNIFDLLH